MRDALIQTYQSYQNQGHLVLCVTLSTFITSEPYAKSDRTRNMWDKHFIGRVQEALPVTAKQAVDHDYVMERSPEGYWHYHGAIAVPSRFGESLWKSKKRALHPRFEKAIRGLRDTGKYRLFEINSFLIEPMVNVGAWFTYITKQQ